jgi:hypothetical protein
LARKKLKKNPVSKKKKKKVQGILRKLQFVQKKYFQRARRYDIPRYNEIFDARSRPRPAFSGPAPKKKKIPYPFFFLRSFIFLKIIEQGFKGTLAKKSKKKKNPKSRTGT